MKKLNIAVIGLGGVGGYFGFKLAQTFTKDAVNITFVARGETFKIVSEKGLVLESLEHPINNTCHPYALVEDIDQLNDIDVFMICVKEYDLEKVCLRFKSKVKDDSILVPLMNGADIYERVRKIINNGILLPTCVYVASHIKEKGVVEHKGIPGKIILGKDPLHPEFIPETIISTFSKAGIDLNYIENSFPSIWTKYIFIASFGLVSACYNKSIGQIVEEPEMRVKASAIMEEIKAIADKKGIELPEDIINMTFEKAGTFPYQTPTSLQLDVQARKENTELELFAGTIIRYGKELGVSTENTKLIYDLINQQLETVS